MNVLLKPEIPETERHVILQRLVQQVLMSVKLIPMVEMDLHIERLRRAESIGPVLDPTLFRANADSLGLELYTCERIRAFHDELMARALLLMPPKRLNA